MQKKLFMKKKTYMVVPLQMMTLLLLIAALLLTASSCGQADLSGTDAAGENGSIADDGIEAVREEPVTTQIPFTDIRLLGRSYQNEQTGVLWFGFTSSGFEFEFSGEGRVEAIFLTDEYMYEPYGAFIGVFINGNEEASQHILMDSIVKNVVLYDSDLHMNNSVQEDGGSEPVVIRVEKLSELKFSDIALTSLRTTGVDCIIKPTRPRDKLIEFIGDSITSGYGILTESMYDSFSTTTEDGSQTYSAITARHFGADLRVISFAGAGVFHSNRAGPSDHHVPLIGEIYLKNNVRRSDTFWDFANQQPAEYIVINIGTNDGVKISEDEEVYGPEFADAYFAFLNEVRDLNPDSHIISSLGPMAFTSEKFLRSAWQRFSQNDENTSFLVFDGINHEEEGLGSATHPTLATHKKMAERLIYHIESLQS